eukprot:3897690-Rhodomonas_salina.1
MLSQSCQRWLRSRSQYEPTRSLPPSSLRACYAQSGTEECDVVGADAGRGGCARGCPALQGDDHDDDDAKDGVDHAADDA